MVTIAERLKQEMEKSHEFTKHNFGAQVGEDFPELARELLADKRIAVSLAGSWLVAQLTAVDIVKSLQVGTGPEALVQKNPAIAKTPFEFFYWGMRVGRELEREESAALAQIEAEGGPR